MNKRQEITSHSLEKPSVTSSAYMRDAVIQAAGPRDWNDTRDSWLMRAARVLGLSHRRTKAIFYGEARRISADEYLAVQARIATLKAKQERHGERLQELASALGTSVCQGGAHDASLLDLPTGEG